jgi:hypothetical protein
MVRSIVIVPAIFAAIPIAIVAGDVSLLPSWFLCISFLACMGLAALFIITGYFRVRSYPPLALTCRRLISLLSHNPLLAQALSKHCEYYRWIRVQWAEAPYPAPESSSSDGGPDQRGDFNWRRGLAMRAGLVLMALATPLSFHMAVWKFQVSSSCASMH